MKLDIGTARLALVRQAIRHPLSESDAFAWMTLLHTHEIHVRPGSLADPRSDRGEVVILPPETQRDVASVLAELWPEYGESSPPSPAEWDWIAALPASERASARDAVGRARHDSGNDDRGRYEHWLWLYNVIGPYETYEDAPESLKQRVDALRDVLAADPRVILVTPEGGWQ